MGTCRECGCTDLDCSRCVEKTGERCYWIEPDLCSTCAIGAVCTAGWCGNGHGAKCFNAGRCLRRTGSKATRRTAALAARSATRGKRPALAK